jgi:hypothetical protein
MTTKLLASGVAAVAAIGAAATGMTPVAMASTGPEGTPGAHHAVPITRGPFPLAPDSDSTEGSEARAAQASEDAQAPASKGTQTLEDVQAQKEGSVSFFPEVPDYASDLGPDSPLSTDRSDIWSTKSQPALSEPDDWSTSEFPATDGHDNSLAADEPASGRTMPERALSAPGDDDRPAAASGQMASAADDESRPQTPGNYPGTPIEGESESDGWYWESDSSSDNN